MGILVIVLILFVILFAVLGWFDRRCREAFRDLDGAYSPEDFDHEDHR